MVRCFIKFVLYIAFSGLISNIIGFIIPRERLNYDAFPYKAFKWEKGGEVYNKLYVTRWKKKVPDMSKILKTLYPKTVVFPPKQEQIDMLLRESCVAEFVHTLLIIVSPVIYDIIGGAWGVFYSVCNALGNIPYIIIQRYNRPKLRRLYCTLCKREAKIHSSEELVNESIDIVM